MKRVFIFLSIVLLISFGSKAQSGILTKESGSVVPATGTGHLLARPINTNSFTFIPLPGTTLPVPAKMQGEGAFPKGSFAISLGLGLGNLYWGGYGSGLSVSPTLIIDDAITDRLGIGNIAVGGTVSYSSIKNAGYNFSAVLIGIRGTYHFILPIDNLDLYGGVLLGYIITNNPSYNAGYYGYGGKASAVQPGIFAGAHYFFVPHFGVYGELGYNGFSVFNFGITFKL